MLADDYKIKISWADALQVYDESEGYLTIAPGPDPTITVIEPDGGEIWTLETQAVVYWTSTNLDPAEYVVIELFTPTVSYTVFPFTPNDGVYSWTVSYVIEPSDDYKIRISWTDDLSVYDESDGYFSVELPTSITVTSPIGGETWVTETTHDIEWTSENSAGDVDIDLYKAGSPYLSIATSEPDDGSYSWEIPTEFDIGTEYTIVVSGPTASDESDGYFSILGGSQVTLTMSASSGGHVFPSAGVHYYAIGTEVTIGAYTYSGYKFNYWLIDGKIKIRESHWTITMDASITAYAYFTELGGGGGGGGPPSPKGVAVLDRSESIEMPLFCTAGMPLHIESLESLTHPDISCCGIESLDALERAAVAIESPEVRSES